jgi:hypothetical protein
MPTGFCKVAIPISRKELLVLLIDQKRNPSKTSKVLVTHLNGSGRSIRMDLTYLNIIKRQIFAPLRCFPKDKKTASYVKRVDRRLSKCNLPITSPR